MSTDDAREVLDLTQMPDDAARLTGVPHLVFYEPRIAGNTGNAIRLSALTGSTLHLVEPLGFDLGESKLKRAGLDYHDLASVVVHPHFDALLAALPSSRVFAFTTQATTRHTDVEYRPDDILLFGPEPTGLPDEALAHPRITEQVRIPMVPGRRSLNLTSSASIVAYEAWRQQDFAGGQ
ncbi:tRNA (cytidine/uridine-2'-O-)-methyltransferase [Paraoerskovia marina]|uniref:Putative tRNA (cytidine(34)-2'-O)-methyltransferase n=2 Tax=Paraoerskovia marina TaxID=545619 RepID=A0A1H1VQ91_9CELL|nr:tRNA (cytidine/uridine-2'-O-)-methyltransferase [Paraoerskovia marina]